MDNMATGEKSKQNKIQTNQHKWIFITEQHGQPKGKKKASGK